MLLRRMQRDTVPTIQFIVELYWLGIDLQFPWQSHSVVRFSKVRPFLRSYFIRRSLPNKQLTGQIPSTIGQLTALTELYVVRVDGS
jgi:hypothetical protein